MRSISSGMMKVVALGLMAMALTCCGPRMGKYDVRVGMDPALVSQVGGAPSVTLNLVGVNEAGLAEWNAKNMQDYWMPADPTRRDAQAYAYVMQFGPGQSETKVLKKDDPIWQKWQADSATHLFVLADLPGSHESRPGSADSRRLVLPLDTRRWSGEQIDIEVQQSTMRLKTEMRPEPKK